MAGTTLQGEAASNDIDILFLITGAIKMREDYEHQPRPVLIPRPLLTAFISSAWAVPSMDRLLPPV